MDPMMRDVLRRLAELEPGEVPVLSVYLDMRPQATGERPAVRSGQIVLKDRLREIEKSLLPRGPALDSFRADRARIERYLDEMLPTAAQGLALFASDVHQLFEVIESGVAFENHVTFAPLPDLFQLARFLDEQETAVVGVIDMSTARLFVTRAGFLEEVEGADIDPIHVVRRKRVAAINQTRYQRHVERHRAEFAQEAADEIERLVEREGATLVILAGDPVSLPLLRAALSPRVAALTQEEPLRLDIRVPRTEVEQAIKPLLAEAERANERSAVDQMFDSVQGDGLGVIGLEETQTALEHGQVDMLLLAEGADVAAETRSDLVRLAALTGADVEVVGPHEAFEELGGLGALLRYRHDDLTDERTYNLP